MTCGRVATSSVLGMRQHLAHSRSSTSKKVSLRLLNDAPSRNQLDLIELLIEYRRHENNTVDGEICILPLTNAIRKTSNPAIVQALLAAGDDAKLPVPAMPYRPNRTFLPLQLAVQTRDIDIVKLIVNANA
jgi:ankyrin repeat protein